MRGKIIDVLFVVWDICTMCIPRIIEYFRNKRKEEKSR